MGRSAFVGDRNLHRELRRLRAIHWRKHWRRASHSKRATLGCNQRSHLACASLERAVGIEPTYENLADFRRTLRPCSQAPTFASQLSTWSQSTSFIVDRAGTRDRTESATLGRRAPDQQDTRIVAVATHAAEACAFTTAGATSENRTRSAPIPRESTAIVLKWRWWRCRELNPHAPACKARPRPDGHPPLAWAPLLNCSS